MGWALERLQGGLSVAGTSSRTPASGERELNSSCIMKALNCVVGSLIKHQGSTVQWSLYVAKVCDKARMGENRELE